MCGISKFHGIVFVENFNKIFQKIAALLREDCAFWVSSSSENMLVFKDPGTEDEQKVNKYVKNN